MQFPTGFTDASTCSITKKTLTEVTEYGMNTEVAKRGNPHKWRVEFQTRLMNHQRARELNAFLETLDGRYGTFTLSCPLPFLSASSNFTVGNNTGGNTVAGSNTIAITGLPENTSDALMAGDYLKFANHDKVYKCILNANSIGGGSAVMSFYPRLVADVPDTTAISEGVFTLRMTKDDLALSLDAKKPLLKTLVTAIEA